MSHSHTAVQPGNSDGLSQVSQPWPVDFELKLPDITQPNNLLKVHTVNV